MCPLISDLSSCIPNRISSKRLRSAYSLQGCELHEIRADSSYLLQTALDAFYSPSRATFAMDSTNMTRVGRLTSTAAPAQTATASKPSALTTPVESTASTPFDDDFQEDEAPIANADAGAKRAISLPEEDEDATGAAVTYLSATPPMDRNKEASLFRQESHSRSPEALANGAAARRPATQSAPVVQSKLSTDGAGWNLSSVSASAPASKRARREKPVTAEEQATLDRMDILFSRASKAARPSISRKDSAVTESSADDVRSEDIDLEEDRQNDDDDDSEGVELEESRTSIAVSDEKNGLEDPDMLEDMEDEDELMILETPAPVVETDIKQTYHAQEVLEVTFDIQDLRDRLKAGRSKRKSTLAPPVPKDQDELAEAGIKTQDEDARKALSRLVSKEDFAKMQIVGQFNLAFIIVRRREAIIEEGADVSAPVRYHDDLMIIE